MDGEFRASIEKWSWKVMTRMAARSLPIASLSMTETLALQRF